MFYGEHNLIKLFELSNNNSPRQVQPTAYEQFRTFYLFLTSSREKQQQKTSLRESVHNSIIAPVAMLKNRKKIMELMKILPSKSLLLAFVFIIATGLWTMLGSFCLFHTYLLLNNQTTLEYYKSFAMKKKCIQGNSFTKAYSLKLTYLFYLDGTIYVNPYDKGSYLKNFQVVYGSKYHWFTAFVLLPFIDNPYLPIDITPETAYIYPDEVLRSQV